jgi:hypothetical protein
MSKSNDSAVALLRYKNAHCITVYEGIPLTHIIYLSSVAQRLKKAMIN